MKALLPYIFALCCLLSCTTPADVSPLLEQAERMMNTRPDSALTLLESIPEPEELSKRHRARWGLLLTQARDKNYVPHTSDSLITTVIDYYRTHNDPRRLAWAYYYDGIIHYELEEFELSQAALLKAEEAGAKVADFDLLGRVYENLGTIYRKQGLTDWVLPMHRKALDANVKLKDSLGIGIAYKNIGRYYMTHDLDSAAYYTKRALTWFPNELFQQAVVYNELSIIYKRKEEYTQALESIEKALTLLGNRNRSRNPYYLNLADVYSKLGQLDSAIVYFQRCLSDPDTRTSAHGALSDIYSQKGDFQKAYTYSNRYATLLDSVRQSKHAADLATQLNKHEKEKAIALLERKHAETKFYGWVIGTIVVVTLLSVALAFMVVSRRRKDELLRISQEMVMAQQKYQQTLMAKEMLDVNYQSVCNRLSLLEEHHTTVEQHSANLVQLKEFIESQLEEKEAEIVNLTAQLSSQMDDFKHHGLMSSAIYRKLVPLMGEKREKKDYKFLSSKEQDWENFYHQMDFAYGGIVTRLKNEYQLSDDFLKVACMSLLDIHPCNAKIIYGRTGTAFTNRRNLLAKVLGVPTAELDAFLQALTEERKE